MAITTFIGRFSNKLSDQERRDSGLEGFRTGGIKEKRDAGKEEFRTAEMLERRYT